MPYKLMCLLLSGLLAGFTTAQGASTKSCPLSTPVTPESYTWNFPDEADQTLADFEKEARLIRTQVAVLQSFTIAPLVSRQGHALELTMIREQVNRLGQRLCRLMEIQRVTEPEQQSTIRSVQARMTELAESTEAALMFINEHHSPVQFMLSAQYRGYLDEMYQNAELLCHCVVDSQMKYGTENE